MASIATTAEGAIRAPPPSVDWLETVELKYELQSGTTSTATAGAANVQSCFGCGSIESSVSESQGDGLVVRFSQCAKCHVASYCSKACQVEDWKTGGHRMACPAYARVGRHMVLSSSQDQQDARTELFGRIRFYACPYAVHKASTLGRGFLFVQSDATLACLSIPLPKDCQGNRLTMRWVLLHYLTLGEYDTEVCREDFELAIVRKTLAQAVESYDDQKEVVLLMRFRCGHVAVGRSILVPDFSLCQRLGRDYYADNSNAALQLNLDDL